jgi:hypothetical protein
VPRPPRWEIRMATFRVTMSGFLASYVERWDAESAEDAERKARQRWERTFGDAGAFRFYARPLPGRATSDDGEDDDGR